MFNVWRSMKQLPYKLTKKTLNFSDMVVYDLLKIITKIMSRSTFLINSYLRKSTMTSQVPIDVSF